MRIASHERAKEDQIVRRFLQLAVLMGLWLMIPVASTAQGTPPCNEPTAGCCFQICEWQGDVCRYYGGTWEGNCQEAWTGESCDMDSWCSW